MMNYHKPVLLEESIDGLNINPDGVYLDLTFGGGGHSKIILEHLKNGKLIAFDQDIDAEANLITDKNFVFYKSNYRFFNNFLRFLKIEKVDGILADLGVSSHHFDTEERGFSFRFDSPLDMRMNKEQKLNAEVNPVLLLNSLRILDKILFKELSPSRPLSFNAFIVL